MKQEDTQLAADRRNREQRGLYWMVSGSGTNHYLKRIDKIATRNQCIGNVKREWLSPRRGDAQSENTWRSEVDWPIINTDSGIWEGGDRGDF